MPRPLPFAIALALFWLGCTTTELRVPEGLIHPECAASAWVEVVPMDIWGRSVSQANITGFSDGSRTLMTPGQAMTWRVDVDGLIGASVEATWSGGKTSAALDISATDRAAVAISHDVLNVDERGCRVYTAFVGLDHPWYSASGRAPRAGNDVALLMNGDEYWQAVYNDLTDPTRTPQRIHQSTWWWMSDFELIRPDDHLTMNPADRWLNTMLSLLERRGGGNRVLVARFAEGIAPGMAYLNTDPLLRAHGRDPNDGFEVMLQGNPVAAPLDAEWDVPVAPFSFVARVRDNPSHTWRSFFEPVGNLEAALSTLEAASYHQKVLMVDDDVAYISGMNVKSTDWDTDQHRVFDHRRMRFNATLAERQAVKDRQALPDQGPRKDYGIRIQGPAARDLDDVLRVRWDHGMATGAMFPEDHTPYTLLDPAPPSGNVTAQVVATMPDPYAEQSILETLNKATRQAKDLIYIEDQYWRAPILHDAIRTAMDANPALHLVVVTKPIALADGGKKYTVLADEELRSLYPDRYLLLQLKTFDREAGQVYFQNMDVHSKIQFIDDVYICVGSANKNNRGMLYEGELNAAVHDPVFVGPARDRVLVNLVGPDRADSIIDRTGAEIFAALKTQALSNASIELELTANPEAEVSPAGFVYPLAIEPGWILEVGPDIF